MLKVNPFQLFIFYLKHNNYLHNFLHWSSNGTLYFIYKSLIQKAICEWRVSPNFFIIITLKIRDIYIFYVHLSAFIYIKNAGTLKETVLEELSIDTGKGQINLHVYLHKIGCAICLSGNTTLYKNAINCKWTLNKKHIPYKNLSQEIHSCINK